MPTYNSEGVLGRCLESIGRQEDPPSQVIVSDGGSTDRTVEIARGFGAVVIEMQANRSAQRNAGARHASGEYLLFIDSDMCLTRKVITECLYGFGEAEAALVIPEVFVGTGFWGRVRGFERRFYEGVWYIEAARWYRRDQFLELGGFDTRLVGPEDWDLDQRIRQFGSVGRINAVIEHNEGHVRFGSVLDKKGHYAASFPLFMELHPERAALCFSARRRIGLFLNRPKEMVRHPALLLGVGVLGAAEIVVSQRWCSNWLGPSRRPERRAV
ncbi:glycosyltransferase [Ferrimicrobium acidiphilum]|uniref:4,4'-diaponeurosporenoate glycosyltransferase n=1 Tax=Ferrimicrobium acidiphilum TaxID=121039 RepID=A0ABV3Y3L4_9ACTN